MSPQDRLMLRMKMAEMLKKTLSIPKGSAVPNRDKVAKISKAQVRKISEDKIQDMNATTLEAADNIVLGTARSMGIELINE